jgi:hypothetical protein
MIENERNNSQQFLRSIHCQQQIVWKYGVQCAVILRIVSEAGRRWKSEWQQNDA